MLHVQLIPSLLVLEMALAWPAAPRPIARSSVHRALEILMAGRVMATASANYSTSPSLAPIPSLARLLRQLEASYSNVHTLRADFTQSYDWEGRKSMESGTVYFARGGRMRWDYRRPEKKVFVSDGKTLSLYVPAEKQLTRSPLKTSEDYRAPFSLLLSRPNLRKLFSTIELADQAARTPGDRVLRALPRRGQEEEYREVIIEISPAFDIRRLEIVYPDRGKMEFTFDRIEQNVALDQQLFQVRPPPGTEIIDQR